MQNLNTRTKKASSDSGISSNPTPAAEENREIRVLLVDAHPAIRDALADKVCDTVGMQVVGTKASAEEALPAIEKKSPDVVVVEISLGGVDGLTLTRRICSAAPQTRVLVFSVYEASMYAEWAIEAGASGYLMKTKPTQEVVQAIRGIAEGEICLGREVLFDILDSVLRPDEEGGDSGVDALSLREMTVFQMLGDGNSVSEIAESLNRSRKTIERHRRRAKEKLGCKTVDELLQYAVLWASDWVGQRAQMPVG